MIKNIGIIGAMEEEVEALRGKLTYVKTTSRASMDFYAGKMGNKEVVIVRSGIGKVNACLLYTSQGNVMTEYEEKFSSKGNPIHKLIAVR